MKNNKNIDKILFDVSKGRGISNKRENEERKIRYEEREKIKIEKEKKWFEENGYEDVDKYYKYMDNESENVPDYKRGKLDPNSSVGFAFISQRVVAKVLGLDISNDCNCEFGFGAGYDLYDESIYNKINVKTSTLHKDNKWNFGLISKFIPDNYICLGFTFDKKDIEHVWIIKHDLDIIKEKRSFNVTNIYKILENYEQYEVDNKPYNDIYHSMSIENCKVLKTYDITTEKITDKCVDYINNNRDYLSKLNSNNVAIIDVNELDYKSTNVVYITVLLNSVFDEMNVDIYAKKRNNKEIFIMKK